MSFENDCIAMLEGWEQRSEKIIEFSKIKSSSRPFLKKVLKDLDTSDDIPYPSGK